MGTWVKERGLLLANAALFLVFFGGMILSGAANYSQEQQAHGDPPVSVPQFLATGEFLEATFENWESGFLQMAMYVVLTVFLAVSGSSPSKTGKAGSWLLPSWWARPSTFGKRALLSPSPLPKHIPRPAIEPAPYREEPMRSILKTVLLALLLLAAPALSAAAASAAQGPAAAANEAAIQADTGSSGGAWVLTGTTPTPSPGDTASTGPGNAGTSESPQEESTRLDFAPWVIGGIALATLVVVLLWRRRRNTTIVG